MHCLIRSLSPHVVPQITSHVPGILHTTWQLPVCQVRCFCVPVTSRSSCIVEPATGSGIFSFVVRHMCSVSCCAAPSKESMLTYQTAKTFWLSTNTFDVSANKYHTRYCVQLGLINLSGFWFPFPVVGFIPVLTPLAFDILLQQEEFINNLISLEVLGLITYILQWPKQLYLTL